MFAKSRHVLRSETVAIEAPGNKEPVAKSRATAQVTDSDAIMSTKAKHPTMRISNDGPEHLASEAVRPSRQQPWA
ncbi:hypothetical protein CKAH01_00959 [Colletotrichum kahawae]|uniref:Uncharacterized protein n=1 Tax=Colletotrichum kahawae TaxID=34407 RepID=A0AAD9YJV3_COLKA|nr:hypothetical protein CcaCcLH18_13688 [Colletotrichum camelliae]KAK2769352.1 hypothetical protein CKAH01_00959 [Colletotrichum kahawae]